jgi:hypothetical protein
MSVCLGGGGRLGNWGAGCGFVRTVMVTHRTFGNDELDIGEERLKKA